MPGTLHLLCGKIASGKTTFARTLSERTGVVLVSEDKWLSTLYPDEISSLDDYRDCSARLRKIMGRHLEILLGHGLEIVLDFPANTRIQRGWMRSLIDNSGADHNLHFLNTPDAICKQRLVTRNASGEHEYQTSERVFDEFCRHFVAPQDDEGFNVIMHDPS